MGYDITKTFYLLPGNGGISREQLAFGHLVKVLEALVSEDSDSIAFYPAAQAGI